MAWLDVVLLEYMVWGDCDEQPDQPEVVPEANISEPEGIPDYSSSC
ncbi:hypothetical protein H6F94_11150 [Leptolyngbya sp. FACHB-261]|nr:hypothetical protein [Leptolyngbya sp. FACHB-261]